MAHDAPGSAGAEELLAEAGWLRALARRLAGDPEEALELEQETWRRALARPPRASGARPWLLAVARNLRLRRRRDAAARAYHERRAAAGESARDERLETLARLDLQARVVAAVRALDEPLRTAVTLRYLDGLDYAEVARRTKTSEPAARKRVSRALAKLRARLDREHGGRAAWSALAFALGRDLPVPPALAPAPVAVPAATTWIGGLLMGTGAKVASTAAVCALVAGGVLWIGGREHGRAAAEAGERAEARALVDPGRDEAALAPAPPEPAERAAAAPAPAPDDAEPAAAPSAVAVRVVDGLGAPVASAEVEVLRIAGRDYQTLDPEFHARETVLARARTGADGRATFPAEPGRRLAVRARAPGLAERDAWAFAGGEVELVLPPAGSVLVQVLRPDDLPATAARLELRPGARERVGRYVARTGAGGVHRFEGLAPGEYTLEVRSLEGATPPWQTIVVAPGEEKRVEVRLADGWRITGRVVDASTGAPIARARVSESWVFETWVESDLDGRFALEHFPKEGYLELEIDAPGYGRRSVTVRGAFEPEPRARDFTVELRPGAAVSGRIVDPSGAGVAGVYVACSANAMEGMEQQTSWKSARTDAAGRYRIPDLRSDLPHALFAQKDGFGTLVFELGPLEGAVELPDVVLRPGFAVTGRVQDDAGRPLAGATVVLAGANADRTERFGHPLPEDENAYVTERETATDPGGRFAFADVAPGAYRVRARTPGRAAAADGSAAADVEVDGADVALDPLVLSAGLAIEGVVLGPDGQGVAGALVFGRGGAQQASTLTAADGSFRLLGLRPGTHQVDVLPIAQVDGRTLARGEAEAEAGDRGLVVHLAEAATLRGLVLEAGGAPAVRATVKMDVAGAPSGWAETDGEGRFELAPPVGARVDLLALPRRADADDSLPHQHVEDQSLGARLADVDPSQGEVVLRLPPR